MGPSEVQVERIVRCPFSVAHQYIEDFLNGTQAELDLRVPLRDFIYGVPLKLRRPVKLVFRRDVDETEEGRGHDAMTLAWNAGTRLIPDFHGILRLRIASIETTRLTFEGTYHPPFGAAGRLFDVVAGRRIARSTMRELLERIGNALEEREAAFRTASEPGSGTAP